MTHFKIVLEKYLNDLAQRDNLFAQAYAKENKNIDDCMKFICNQALVLFKERQALLGENSESGYGMSDEEVYALATHYYDEDEIDIGSDIACQVVTNQRIELTVDEIALAKQRALDKIVEEEKRRLRGHTPKQAKIVSIESSPTAVQGSLF